MWTDDGKGKWSKIKRRQGGGSGEAESRSRYNGSHSSLWQPSKHSTGGDTNLRHHKCSKCTHTFAYKCVHTQRKYVFMIPYFVVYAHTHSSILFWVNGKSLHTPLHCSLCKHKPETLSSVQIFTLLSTSILPLTCTHVKICILKMQWLVKQMNQ